MQRSLETIWVIALTDFKLRYSNSILGYLWSLLKPLLIFAVLYVVFTMLVQLNIENYQLHLLLGIILWNFFAESTTMGMYSLLIKANLIAKMRISRWMLVIASTVTSVMTLCINVVIFFIALFLSGIELQVTAWLFIPYLIGLYLLVLGISFFLSVMNIRYRDIGQMWEVLLQALFFLSPIVYSLDIVPAQYHRLMFLNPITPIVQYSRHVLISGEWTSWYGNLAAALMVALILIVGMTTFRLREKHIAEEL